MTMPDATAAASNRRGNRPPGRADQVRPPAGTPGDKAAAKAERGAAKSLAKRSGAASFVNYLGDVHITAHLCLCTPGHQMLAHELFLAFLGDAGEEVAAR